VAVNPRPAPAHADAARSLTPQPRILILSAAIGEGHDLPARMLRDGILRERPDAEVAIRDGLAEAGGLVAKIAGQEAPLQRRWLNWLFDLEYRVLVQLGPVRRVVGWLSTRLCASTVERLVRELRPRAIVSTYPGVTEVCARMRRSGKLDVPVCSAITDLSALWFWASPGVDLHLITHEESEAEVRGIAPDSRIAWVRGLTSPQFEQPRDELEARRDMDLPESGGVVLVSGGGWGVGDMHGAIETTLTVPGVEAVVVLCGRSEFLKKRLGAQFGSDPRVRLLGFTDRMSDLMAASDALVHSTAGLTVLEAWIRGCTPISYGWGVAHIRVNNAAFERFGIAHVATSRADLRETLERALAAPRHPFTGYGELPSAAAEVLRLAGA
jgi:UDP-N-acetylglucosamine:LPS N-acetylglucosamine transferase